MTYFLKKTKFKTRTSIAIYESFYNPIKKEPSHRCYKSLGSVESQKAKGVEDPIAYYQKMVDELNVANKKDRKKISEVSYTKNIGYFPLKSILEKLKVKREIDIFKLITNYNFDLYELLSALIYARCINPCSKLKTFHEVIPNLYETFDFSYDQLLDGLSFLGNEYKKIVEIFTRAVHKVYGVDASKNYFDCTNFYFEIDREDALRRKGPSKENRKDPIVGLGLLLDKNQIPISMQIYPGNESEKPVMRKMLDDLKNRHNITGKTIFVADKGLNCAQNIAFLKKSNDGYLFSKSVKTLPEKEKEWVLLENDYKNVKNSNGKILYRYKACIDIFPYTIEHEGKKYDVKLKEKRLITYNPELAEKKIHEINKLIDKALKLKLSQAKSSEYGEVGKYVTFTNDQGGKANVSLNQKAIDSDKLLAGYNLIVTSEIYMPDEEMYSVYHNLWRIEESFRIMKSDLDARPVFVQKESTIKGHFLICYLAVLLERIFQFYILNNKFTPTEIFHLFKHTQIFINNGRITNISNSSQILTYIAEKETLPLLFFDLSKRELNAIMDCKL